MGVRMVALSIISHEQTGKKEAPFSYITGSTLVNVYVDLLVFTRIAGTS